MTTNTEQTLAERLLNPTTGAVNPHEIARELTQLCERKDRENTRKLRDAYLIGVWDILPSKTLDTVRAITDENLLYAAQLADRVAKDGYEASGQLHIKPQRDGPITKFFREATGYKA